MLPIEHSLLNSENTKNTKPIVINTNVVINTSLVYMDQSLMCLEEIISSQTINPMPPTTIRMLIVINTIGLFWNTSIPEPGDINPIKSKPALQKAETE